MPRYNGHKNWNHWNVSLWINNDERLYREALAYIKEEGSRTKAAPLYYDWLKQMGVTHTPDGAPYSISAIYHAMEGTEA